MDYSCSNYLLLFDFAEFIHLSCFKGSLDLGSRRLDNYSYNSSLVEERSNLDDTNGC